MERYEYGVGNIGAAIKLYSTDGRKFNQIYKFDLYANTAPVLEYAGIGKTTVGTDDYYVLLFRVKDMDATVTTGVPPAVQVQLRHKDIKKLIVTAGGVPSEIPLSFNSTKTDFLTGGDLLAAAQKLKPTDPPLPSPTAQDWILRLKTDVKVGGPEKVYDVSIKDEQGLSSAVIRASTQKNKLSDVALLDGATPIPDPADMTSAGATDGNPKVFAGMSAKTLTAQAAPAGAAITGTVSRFSGSPDTWVQLSGSSGTVNGTTPVTVNLPALAAGETEALYKITLKAQLTGYTDSDEKTFFVKLLRQELPVLTLKQDFSSSGQSFQKNISAETAGYVSEDIIPNAGNYNTATKPLVIYNLNGRAAFLIAPRTGSGATVMYKLNTDPEHSATTEATIRLPNAPAAHTLQVWAVKNGVEGPKTTLHIKVIKAITAYSELKNVVKNAPAGNEIQINIGGNLTASSADTEIAVSVGKNLKLIPSSGGIYTIDAGGNGRIFKVSGSGTVLNLEDIKLEGGNASTGGAVYVEDGGILKLTGETVITPSTGADINTPGKNDVYLATGTSIKVDNALTGSGTIARITPNYIDGNTVLTGSSASSEYTKFSVTQTDDGFLWKIKSDGTLQAIPTTINGGSGAWKRLKDAVQNLPEGSTITVNGEINATAGSGSNANNGVIDIKKNLTIQSKTGADSDILNANRDNLGTNAHPVFRVSDGKTLTLKNLTLKGGKGISGSIGGGAINVTGSLSKAELTDCTIEDCEAEHGGAIGCSSGTTVKLTNTHIKKCKATGSGSASGGGAIFASGATVEMTGCTLTNNEASVYGGGIYVTDGSLTLTNTTIGGEQFYDGTDSGKTKGNKAKSGGGVYIEGNGTSVTMNGGSIQYNKTINGDGGGVCIKGSAILFTMNGGKITQCKADVTSTSSMRDAAAAFA
ncbi:hypothetical protein [Treponema socranskii]|uniref:right-handed parallel beta-helix repeat-containing protein n=1 Tax=Treponema socranskii TaxID=53419 RepID=UPI003D918CA6